jgi:hypothetical protein
MASPARCLALQQALALLNGASNAEVEHVGGAYGVIRPLQQLRAALPARLDRFQVELSPDLPPPRPPLPRCPCQRLRFTAASSRPSRRTRAQLACGASLSREGAAELQTLAATRQEAPATEVRLPTRNKVPALPVEVVERLLPLVPACTLLRVRAVSRCVRPPSWQRPRQRCRSAVIGGRAADGSGGGAAGSGGEEVALADGAAGSLPRSLAVRRRGGCTGARRCAARAWAQAPDVGNLRPPPRAREPRAGAYRWRGQGRERLRAPAG